MWRAGLAGASLTVVLIALLAGHREQTSAPRMLPRRGGPAPPLIFAPRHRQVAARPMLHLVGLHADQPMNLEVRRASGVGRISVMPGVHAWPQQEPDLTPGELVTLLLTADQGLDRTEIWLASPREVALWERGGRSAAERLACCGFPGPALVAAAVAGSVPDTCVLRVGLPPELRLKAAGAWISTDEPEQR